MRPGLVCEDTNKGIMCLVYADTNLGWCIVCEDTNKGEAGGVRFAFSQ